jgi:hypothetical protein
MIEGVGTGKTTALLIQGVNFAEQYPKSLCLVVRKEFADLRDSTMKDFTQYFGKKINTSPADYTFPNGSVLMFRHGNANDLAALRNLNLAWVGIEQGEEYEDAEVFNYLRERIRRSTAPYRQLSVIANSNGRNWLWEIHVEKADIVTDRSQKVQIAGRVFRTDEVYYAHTEEYLGKKIEYKLWTANSFVNAHNLPLDTVADWLSMEQNAPNHYKRMIMNSFDEVDDSDLLLSSDEIQKALNQEFLFDHDRYHTKIMSVDIASTGEDSCVAGMIEQQGPMHWAETIFEKWGHKGLMESTGKILALRQLWKPDILVVDADGMGEGVWSRIKENGIPCVGYHGGRRLDTMKHPDRFTTQSAEDAFFIKEQLVQGSRLKILPELIPELQTVRYTYDSAGGKIGLVPKSQMRKSPDHWDMLKMACAQVESQKAGAFQAKRRQPRKAIGCNPFGGM